MSFRRSCPFK